MASYQVVNTIQMVKRHRSPELMDQPELDAEEHRHALAGLARINQFSRSARILWPPLQRLAQKLQRPIRILDVASGGGDVGIRLWQQAQRQGYDFEIAGVDVSPVAVDYARRQAALARAPLQLACLDVLKAALPGGYDATVSSLFLHHLSAIDAGSLLTKMAAATKHLLLINDLRRTRYGYWLAQCMCRLLTRSRVVHVDGPRSVASAFTEHELRQVFIRAGLAKVTIRRRWPLRMLAIWSRDAE